MEKKRINWNRAELLIWLSIGILFILPQLFVVIKYSDRKEGLFLDYYGSFVIGFSIILFPVLFNIIFSQMPFESIREQLLENQQSPKSPEKLSIPTDTEAFEHHCIANSRRFTDRLIKRSGVFLLLGCFIAMTGVSVYGYILYQPKKEGNSMALMELLPWTSLLLFIELIAFFFLKQYRVMMEEHRYYDSIKREREDNLIHRKQLEQYKDDPAMLNQLPALKKGHYSHWEISKGKTTQLLEGIKRAEKEVNLFDKLIDLSRELKK